MYIYFDARIECTSETPFADCNLIKLLRFKFPSTLNRKALRPDLSKHNTNSRCRTKTFHFKELNYNARESRTAREMLAN